MSGVRGVKKISGKKWESLGLAAFGELIGLDGLGFVILGENLAEVLIGFGFDIGFKEGVLETGLIDLLG